MTDEAWHVRLYHNGFLCYSLVGEQAIVDIGIVGQSHEAPCRGTLR